MNRFGAARLALGLFGVAAFGGCATTVKRMAVNSLAEALASGDGTVYSGDNSPYLIKEATPFGLKLMETLLQEVPTNEKLLLALASGFTQYAFAFVKQDADEIEEENLEKALGVRDEARKLLLRARDYALRSLELKYPGFRDKLFKDPTNVLAKVSKADVPQLYWTGASWGAAISISKDDTNIIGDLPIVEALMERALALDESYDNGAIHGFFISYEMSRLADAEENAARARKHFERAVELSKGQNAGFYVGMAEAVSVTLQNRKEFEELLNTALAIDVDKDPKLRLANTIFQNRARWLLARVDRLFL